MKKTYFLAVFAILTVVFLGLFMSEVLAYSDMGYDYNNYVTYPNPGYGFGLSTCTYHAYKQCMGNNIFWFDSCGNPQDLYASCFNGQVCQFGQCAVRVQPVKPPVQPSYTVACYGNDLYSYNLAGQAVGLYKKCADNNSCTLDTCSSGKCSNVLKCDSTTCSSDSADFNKYCKTEQTLPSCGNGTCEQNLGETPANCSSDCKAQTGPLFVAFFVKHEQSEQWAKSAEAGENSQFYFIVSVANSSASQLDDVNVSVNIPGQVSSLGNVQVDGVSVSGDVSAGINIGSLAPMTAKAITFEGRTETISEESTGEATATAKVSGSTQSDVVNLTFKKSDSGASVSGASTNGFINFLKRWYLWILVALVLVFLFIVVFRRLSSNV